MAFNFKPFIYPTLCAHCQDLISEGSVLCSSCLSFVTLETQEGRCPRCFASDHQNPKYCPSSLIRSSVATIEKIGPAYSLFLCAKRGHRHLFAAIASLLSYQWLRFDLPLPDCIVPLASSSIRLGFDPNTFLATHLASLWDLPVECVIKKSWNYRRFFREAIIAPHFTLKTGPTDKRILLVALEFDRSLFEQAAIALQPAFPKQIDALAFACGYSL